MRSAGEPVWLVEDSQGQRFALSAIDGSLRETTPDQALKIAENWFNADSSSGVIKASYLETVEKPIILRNQDALSPFHRIAVGEDGGELLISSRTGEVLHASTRVDRAFYWAGNWLHLLKPLESIGLGKIRNDVQLWLGLSATIATLTGLIIGWLRWRPGFGGKPTYSEGRTQPYREFWFKWHFWSGLIGGTVVLSWALSGFLDTNPGKIFSQANPSRQEVNTLFGERIARGNAYCGSRFCRFYWLRLSTVRILSNLAGDDWAVMPCCWLIPVTDSVCRKLWTVPLPQFSDSIAAGCRGARGR